MSIKYISKDIRLFDDEEKKIIAWCINYRGTGDHPWAEPMGLSMFAVEYCVECVENALDHRDIDQDKLNTILDLLGRL